MSTRYQFERGDSAERTSTPGDACTLAVVADSDARWEVELIANFATGGGHVVGTIRTCPAVVSKAPASRVLAMAATPGAVSYTLRAKCLGSIGAVQGTPSDDPALAPLLKDGTPLTLELEAAHAVAEPLYRDHEWHPTSYVSGNTGTVTLGRSQRLVSIAATAGAGGGSFSVNGGPSVAVPAFQTVTVTYREIFGAVVAFDTASYLVEVEG